jgi:beta-galactosidase
MERRMILIAAFLAAAASPVAAAPVIRSEIPLNAGWRFHRGDITGAQQTDMDDHDWVGITLPHTFNGGDGEDGGGYYRGPAWYRRVLVVAHKPSDRRAFLQFDGVALNADVYVNGHLLKHHEGGYAGFRLDVTDALHAGDNVIAVRADNSRATIAPLGGDFTVFGGIYRSVSLIETGTVHIDMLDHGGPGVYGHVTALSAKEARVSAMVRVANDGDAPRTVIVHAVINDAGGHPAAWGDGRLALNAHAVQETSIALTVAAPHHWDGRRDPYLYRLAADVREVSGTVSLDEVAVPLGFRSASFDPARGFLLNGKPYPLHGVDYFHPERPGAGTAVTDAQIDADMDILNDLGVTGLRLVHFQHPKRVYDDADRMGLPVWTEIPLNGAIDHGTSFRDNIEEQMRELIRQNYNHPSVVMWGIGNEVYATDPAVTRTLRAVQEIAHQEDPIRPTVYAHCCQSDDDPKAEVSDLIGFNRYFGWYPEQRGSIGAWADGYHRRFPNRAFAVSEYGAGASIRQQQEPPPAVNHPSGDWHPEQAQTAYHIDAWRELRDRPYLFGTFVWVGFDLASDGRHEGDHPGINDKGLVTYDRATRKDAFYWYQANWAVQPVLHLLDRRLTPRTDKTVDVAAVANTPTVTLMVNGKTVGTRPTIDHIAHFPAVALKTGDNHVMATGRFHGAAIMDTLDWRVTAPSAFGVTPIPLAQADAKPTGKAPPGQ